MSGRSEPNPRRSSRGRVEFVTPLVNSEDAEEIESAKVQRSDVQHQSPVAKKGKTALLEPGRDL